MNTGSSNIFADDIGVIDLCKEFPSYMDPHMAIVFPSMQNIVRAYNEGTIMLRMEYVAKTALEYYSMMMDWRNDINVVDRYIQIHVPSTY